MDAGDDLRLLLASRTPLIVARMDDEERFMTFARRAAQILQMPVWTWSLTRGLARDGMATQTGTQDPRQALGFIGALPDPGLFILFDLRPSLQDPAVVRTLKELTMIQRPDQTIVVTVGDGGMPHELDGFAIPWTLEPPSAAEVEALVERTGAELAGRGLAVALTMKDRAALGEAGRGLSLPEIQRLIIRSATEDGRLDANDVERVREAKAELLADDGVLELIPDDVGDLDAIGGLGGLKDWLRVRGRGFEPKARDFGLEAPRGVLLAGVPGCGKSMVAKTLARTWRMPLVLLDPGAVFGPYVGESETRLGAALRAVEAMAPLVLWIDEIEKGFAASGASADGGVSLRILGTFLRWLQDRPPGVFLVATCNDVQSLPPELLRRGRFDETFFVDLPSPQERQDILGLHLRRRHRDPAGFDLARLAAASDGFSGAELEGAIVGALYRDYAAGTELSTQSLLAELGRTVPLARTRAEDIARMRSWAEGRAVLASG